MITDAEIRSLSVPERLFAYADAYLRAAVTLCHCMTVEPKSAKWSNATVVLMLASHAVELFLKGAILTRAPSFDVWNRGHNLLDLAADYQSYFSELSFEWNIPFQAEFPDGLGEAEINTLKKRISPPGILYRYPVQKRG